VPQTLSGGLTVNGTLNLGGNTLTLSGGSSSIAAITGSCTIVVGAGATLTLTAAIVNTGVNIRMAGGTINLGDFTHSLGELSQTSASTIEFTTSSNLTVANISHTEFTGTLSASDWVADSSRLYATAVGGNPARGVVGLAPLNQIALGSNAASRTYWASGTPGELLAGPSDGYTFWDVTPGNSAVDGGTGTWNGSNTHWTSSTGSPNGVWAGGSSVATFQGTAGVVTVSGTQNIGGLTFNTDGYTLSGGTALALQGGSNTITTSTGTATISTRITGATTGMTFAGPGTTVLTHVDNSYAGNTTISSGTVLLNRGTNGCAGGGNSSLGYGEVTIAAGAVLDADPSAPSANSDNPFGCFRVRGANTVTRYTVAGTMQMRGNTTAELPHMTLAGGLLTNYGTLAGNAGVFGTYVFQYPVQVTADSTIGAFRMSARVG
jgi:autotransporter-associated beta strand protein